jgi:VanZ family protein
VNRSVSNWLRKLAWWGVGLWAATITTLSSMTPPQIEEIAPFQMWDKAAHFAAFTAGGINLTLALAWSTLWPWKRVIIFTAIALAVFGAADEIHQLFTPNRSGADPYDWTADMLGAVTGTLLTSLIYARYCRPRRPTPAGA